MNLRDFTIYDIFKRNVKLFRDKTAILYEDKEITFGELFDKAKAAAGLLNYKGIAKGDRIAVLTKNCHQFFTLMGAIAALGRIMFLINFRLFSDEINYILNDIKPAMLFSILISKR